MTGWRDRLLAEKDDLDAKRFALGLYLNTEREKTLPQAARELLRLQALAMNLYSEILEVRIRISAQ